MGSNVISGVCSVSPPVTDGSGVLWVLWERISWGPHGKMRYHEKIPFQRPISLHPPWKKFSLVFSRAGIKATAHSLCSLVKCSPVQHLASSVCVPSCIHCVWGPHGPGSWGCLRPHGRLANGWVRVMEQESAREQENKRARERIACLGA